MSNYPLSDGQKLSIFLIIKQLSKKDFAQSMGISDTKISLFLQMSVFSKKIKQKICLGLGITEEEFDKMLVINSANGSPMAIQAKTINVLKQHIEALKKNICINNPDAFNF